LQNQYFYRTVVFTRANNQVALADIEHPNKTTPFEPWLGTVISLADGKHTLAQLTQFMMQQYPQAPENLTETLKSVVERLVEGKFVKLSKTPVELPYYLASPIEQLDIEKAKKLIIEDGYNIDEQASANQLH
jgi:hypothetical protein